MPRQLAALNGSMKNDRYWIVKKLGKGEFGKVYEVSDEWDVTKKKYAAKCGKEFDHSTHCERRAYKELTEKVHGIPRLVDSFRFLDRYVLVFPMYLGDLDTIREGDKRKELSLTNIYKIAYDMMFILERIHGFGFLHRDIRPANIMLRKMGEKEGRLVLGDFASSVKYYDNGKLLPVPENDFRFATYETATWRMTQRLPSAESEDCKMVAITLLLCRAMKPFEAPFPDLVLQKMKWLEEDPARILGLQTKQMLQVIKALVKLPYREPVNYQKIRDAITKGSYLNFDAPFEYFKVGNRIRMD